MLLRRFDGRLGKIMPTLDEEASDLVNHRRAALYQSVAHPMKSLQVELFVGLDGNKPHVLPSRGFGNGLSIQEVVLV